MKATLHEQGRPRVQEEQGIIPVLAMAVISGSVRSIGEPTIALATSDGNQEADKSSEEDSSDDDAD